MTCISTAARSRRASILRTLSARPWPSAVPKRRPERWWHGCATSRLSTGPPWKSSGSRSISFGKNRDDHRAGRSRGPRRLLPGAPPLRRSGGRRRRVLEDLGEKVTEAEWTLLWLAAETEGHEPEATAREDGHEVADAPGEDTRRATA